MAFAPLPPLTCVPEIELPFLKCRSSCCACCVAHQYGIAFVLLPANWWQWF